MSFLKKLFGGGGSAKTPPSMPSETHNGFTITAAPVNDGGTWRIGARIEKEIDGEVKSHFMMRADTLQSFDDAAKASVDKARMLVDQQGDRIFT
ncbi:MAG: HlyU family transcriptional regulator [Marivita sp.]|uniref:HlyU family transcriptional regulator n=1 Tax=Marivita sp. TaxID=2003365 RepID=UPI003EFA19A7